MFTHKDIQYRSIFVINCLQERSLRVSNGELLLEEKVEDSDKTKTLTKMPFQKILAIFIIGHIKVTTPLIEKCQKNCVALVVMKPSFRPVFFWANAAEANFVLHQRQYEFKPDDITIAKLIVENKIRNQQKVLQNTRRKDNLTQSAKEQLQACIDTLPDISNYNSLMGIEGNAAKVYFSALFQDMEWKRRCPRTKADAINATLDIGYTMLFNYIECFLRIFGFDIYIGVYHRLWYKRKSLVCDLVEPFRPIIDRTIRTAWNRKQITESDFKVQHGEYVLKRERNGIYCQLFFEALIPYKTEVFKYLQSYYRCFMGNKDITLYPTFTI